MSAETTLQSSAHAVTRSDQNIRLSFADRRESRGREYEVQSDNGVWSLSVSTISSSLENGIREFLKSRLKTLPDVRHVKIAERTGRSGRSVIHIWTSLVRDDRATRYKVYDVEQELVDQLPEFAFEFHSHLERESAPDGDTTVYEARNR